jgi:hypothetical protein
LIKFLIATEKFVGKQLHFEIKIDDIQEANST